MINRDKVILIEITNLIKKMRGGGFFKDGDILEAIEHYITAYTVKEANAKVSWKITPTDEFFEDLKTMKNRPMAEKYNCTVQAINYYRRKMGTTCKKSTKC
jgi:hypothetical protein